MPPTNLLILMSDEHSRQHLGCYGNPVVRTPHLDALAARGTTFVNAYANSPICVPTRASIATGRYVHQLGCWDSAQPYRGQVPSWGHRLIRDGRRAVSVGKLHYRSDTDSNGFDEEIVPMHILKGVGWPKALLRDPLPSYPEAAGYAAEIGRGESDYTAYDRRVCRCACDWLKGAAPRSTAAPWVLFVSFVAPHYPLVAPAEFYDLYSPDDIPPPRQPDLAAADLHPAVAAVRGFFNYADHFTPETARIARTAYYGLCSFLDHHIGQVLGALEESGQAGNTRVIYLSDHGDCLGNRGMWAKSVMYEESAGVPLIMAGPDVPPNHRVATPVSHVDCYPTVIQGAGLPAAASEADLPGRSLLELAVEPAHDRAVFSEYHDGGSITGSFMIRQDRWKYIHHPGYRPELYDLRDDPHETHDRGRDPELEAVRRACDRTLRAICDPEQVNAAAFAAQRRRLAELGGEQAALALETFDYTPLPA